MVLSISNLMAGFTECSNTTRPRTGSKCTYIKPQVLKASELIRSNLPKAHSQRLHHSKRFSNWVCIFIVPQELHGYCSFRLSKLLG